MREVEALLQRQKEKEELKKEMGSPKYKDIGHSDRLYEDSEARKLRISKLKQKVGQDNECRFEPVLVTKNSSLSQKNLNSIQDGGNHGGEDHRAPRLSSLGFEERNKEFSKRKRDKLEAMHAASQPLFSPNLKASSRQNNKIQPPEEAESQGTRFVKLYTDSLLYEEKR